MGKLLRLVPLRQDLSYLSKELSRTLSAPTEDDYLKLKHAIRCLNGTEDDRMTIGSSTSYIPEEPFDVITFVDSDWTGCTTTRNSTTSCSVTARGNCIHHYSRTQSTVALSSGEAELHAIGPGTTETMRVVQFPKGCDIKVRSYATIATDNTAGKSMASRICVSRATKYIQLRLLYIQDLVAQGIVRLEKVDTKGHIADLDTLYLAVDQVRSLCELHPWRASAPHCNIQSITQQGVHAELAGNYRHLQSRRTQDYVMQSAQTMFTALPVFMSQLLFVHILIHSGQVIESYIAAAVSAQSCFVASSIRLFEREGERCGKHLLDGGYHFDMKLGGGTPLTVLFQALQEREKLHVGDLRRVDLARDNL